jgi:hypothetical protein
MGWDEIVANVADPYERQARLYPSLLALSPIIVLVTSIYGPKVSILSNAFAFIGTCGGLVLLANISRELGKRLEAELFDNWGGKPSTQLLRHRDNGIEAVTKSRYHDFLSAKIKMPFPAPHQENADPSGADDLYLSGVRWLLNQTRDPRKFGLLFKENISYGFRRNALGLKKIGLSISLSSILFVLLKYGVIVFSTQRPVDIQALSGLPESATVSLVTSIAMCSIWCVFFTADTVKTSAFSYAETLLRACDALDN